MASILQKDTNKAAITRLQVRSHSEVLGLALQHLLLGDQSLRKALPPDVRATCLQVLPRGADQHFRWFPCV